MPSVIVCGLGTLGQHCARKLKEFGTTVVALELSPNPAWELPAAFQSIDRLVVGDCRDGRVLEDAGLDSARAVLIVTREERINIAAAFAVRAVNPSVRIVIRSGQARLGDLLTAHLEPFVAFEPVRIAAPAFALEALGDDVLGLFKLEGRAVRIVGEVIDPASKSCNLPLAQLDSHQVRVLSTSRAPAEKGFCAWEPDDVARPGDRLTRLELDNRPKTVDESGAATNVQRRPHRFPAGPGIVSAIWAHATQTQRIAAVSFVVLGALYLLGVALYKHHYGDISLHDALNVSLVLILGGYDNLFGSLRLPFPIPPALHVFSVLETIAGTVFIGIVYAFLTERVLSARFQLGRTRPKVPKAKHVVVCGLADLGTEVARYLRSLDIPVVVADPDENTVASMPDVPFVRGAAESALAQANAGTALSVMALTNDEVANLELALVARALNRDCTLVIRTQDPQFSENVSRLVPRAHAMAVHDLAGEAFAAAAFGESILGLVRIDGQTTLVTEYRVESGDSLEDLLLAELMYGYGIVPLLHETGGATDFLPGDEKRLRAGDRLIVLATIDGLQRVEQRLARPPQWQLHVERALTKEAAFEGALRIARSTRCGLEAAQAAMASLPCVLECALYKQQAQRLVRKLARTQVEARIEPLSATSSVRDEAQSTFSTLG